VAASMTPAAKSTPAVAEQPIFRLNLRELLLDELDATQIPPSSQQLFSSFQSALAEVEVDRRKEKLHQRVLTPKLPPSASTDPSFSDPQTAHEEQQPQQPKHFGDKDGSDLQPSTAARVVHGQEQARTQQWLDGIPAPTISVNDLL
jgi:hypothetical protein